jgi:hypothetical protein
MLEEQLKNTLVLLQDNPIIAAVIVMIVLVLFYSRPKEMFRLVIFCVFMAGVFYFITLIAETLSTGSRPMMAGVNQGPPSQRREFRRQS